VSFAKKEERRNNIGLPDDLLEYINVRARQYISTRTQIQLRNSCFGICALSPSISILEYVCTNQYQFFASKITDH
jgi:hypothetical protein